MGKVPGCTKLRAGRSCANWLTWVSIHGEGCRDATSDSRRLRTITITGHTPQQNVERNRVRNTYTADDARVAMGMPWATIAELSQAIPPAYSHYIARAWLGQQRRAA